MKRLGPASLGLCALLCLIGCNDSDQALRTIEPDWMHDPITESPSPSPSATPSPTPTPTPSPSPTSTPIGLYTGPAAVEPYVQKFVTDAWIQGIDVTPDMQNPKLEIQLASLDSYGTSVIGLCETGGNRRRVTFDPDFWNSVSETQRELLAHHELGHCVLYRAHRSTLLSSGAYASVMYPIIMSSSTYRNSYDYYQQELFTYGAQAPSEDPTQIQVHVCDHHPQGSNE